MLTHGDQRLGLAAIGCLFFASVLGFLIHNWPPAKIYLGDCGSLLIGLVIGAFSIQSSLKTATGFTLMVPIVLLGVPIFDTAVAIIRRKLNGKGIGEADRGHIHHRLLDRGLTRGQALTAILVLSLATSVSALLSVWLDNEWIGIGICASLFIVLVAGRVFGYDETALFVAQVRVIGSLFRETRHVLKTRLVLTRLDATDDESFDETWLTVQRRVQRMGGCSIEFLSWNESDQCVRSELHWQNEESEPSQQIWRFSYSLRADSQQRLAIRATGFVTEQARTLRIDDLYHLFEAICQRWSQDNASASLRVVSYQTVPEWALEAAEVKVIPFADGQEQHKAA